TTQMGPLRRNPEGRGFPGDLRCHAARQWGLPLASRRFVHLIPASRRRDHAGLIQRFLRTMCGIVGAVARENVVPILIEGIRRLEYRGYDSSGMAVTNGRLPRL